MLQSNPEHSKPEPQDLGDAIAHCEAQLKRLGLIKQSPVVVLWLEMNSYAGDWARLDYNGFANLYRFLKQCK
jgi:hypothetical protein